MTNIKIVRYDGEKWASLEIAAVEVSGVWAYDARNVVTHVPTGCMAYHGETMRDTKRMFLALAKELPAWGKRAKWMGRGLKGRTAPVVAILKRVDPRVGDVVRI